MEGVQVIPEWAFWLFVLASFWVLAEPSFSVVRLVLGLIFVGLIQLGRVGAWIMRKVWGMDKLQDGEDTWKG